MYLPFSLSFFIVKQLKLCGRVDLIEDDTMDGEGRAKQDARAENAYSIVEINNATDDPLSPCPKGAKLENQFRVAYMDVCT